MAVVWPNLLLTCLDCHVFRFKKSFSIGFWQWEKSEVPYQESPSPWRDSLSLIYGLVLQRLLDRTTMKDEWDASVDAKGDLVECRFVKGKIGWHRQSCFAVGKKDTYTFMLSSHLVGLVPDFDLISRRRTDRRKWGIIQHRVLNGWIGCCAFGRQNAPTPYRVNNRSAGR